MKKRAIKAVSIICILATMLSSFFGFGTFSTYAVETDEDAMPITENLYYPIGYGTPNTSTRDGFKSSASGYTASKSVAVTAGDVIYYGPYSVNEANVFITYGGNGNAVANTLSPSVYTTFANGDVVYKCTIPSGVSAVAVKALDAYGVRMVLTKNAPFDEAGYNAYWESYDFDAGVTKRPDSPLKGKSVLFIGDSITYGSNDSLLPSNGVKGFAGRIGVACGLSNVVNAGVSGTGFLSSWSGGVENPPIINQFKANMDGDFDAVVIGAGVNDSRNGYTEDKIVEAFGKLLSTIRAELPDAKVFFVAYFHIDKFSYIDPAKVTSMYEAIKTFCDANGVEYINLYDNEELNATLACTTARYLPDKAHPTSEAYDIITPYIIDGMEAAFADVGGDASGHTHTKIRGIEKDASNGEYVLITKCKTCGEVVETVGYVSDREKITLYTDTGLSKKYDGAKITASEKFLYVNASSVDKNAAKPYWITFDYKLTGNAPTIDDTHAQADMENKNSWAYKGLVFLGYQVGANYWTALRVILDGWEKESVNPDGTRGTTDGKVPLKLNGEVFRDQATVTELSKGGEYKFAIRVQPSGAYDVYVNGTFAASGALGEYSTQNSYIGIRFGDSNLSMTSYETSNIDVFAENYAEAKVCFHEEEKAIIKTDGGYTLVNKCKSCGRIVGEIGSIDDSETVGIYKKVDGELVAYTADELKSGFTAAEKLVYTDSGVITTDGKPFWIMYDLELVSGVPTVAAGDAHANVTNADYIAYKGFTAFGYVLGNSYPTLLRYIPDGWEKNSGATGTTIGETDGKVQLNVSADDYKFREAPTAAEISVGDKLSIAFRVDPATGEYDVYVDGEYKASSKIETVATGSDSGARFRFGDGNIEYARYGACSTSTTNITVFKEKYTPSENAHVHSPTEKVEFYDDGVYYYLECDCGKDEKAMCEGDKIAEIVKDGLPHIYHGIGEFEFDSDSYWFVTDVTVGEKVFDGKLITVAGDVLLEIREGVVLSGNTAVLPAKAKTSFQVAIEFNGGEYSLRVNGKKVATGACQDAGTISLGDKAFGDYVRFLYNKAVVLGNTATSVIPTYEADPYVRSCGHDGGECAAEDRCVIKGADGRIKLIYTCGVCGQRVYSELSGDLTNPQNDEDYKYKPLVITRAELSTLETSERRTLYLENNVISKTSNPYWITFSVTPNSFADLAEGDLYDMNTVVFRGFNMLSAEASFFPASHLRVIPDGWETWSETDTSVGAERGEVDGKAEVRIIYDVPYWEGLGVNSVFYRKGAHVATLEIGVKTDFALRIDPKTGIYDVYVNGEYKASSKKVNTEEYIPQIHIHDDGAGEFTYTDIRVVTEARSFKNKVTTVELTTEFTVDNTAKVGSAASLAYIKRTGAEESKVLNLIYAENRTGKLLVDTAEGRKYLTNSDGETFVISGIESIAVIYDGVEETLRYYVGDRLAFIEGTKAVNIAIADPSFAESNGTSDIIKVDTDNVSSVNIYTINPKGTSRFVGFQEHTVTGEIRILSGVDVVWYEKVGYRVECYDETGKFTREEILESETIFDGVLADGKTVYAEFYGFDYFLPLKVTGVNIVDYKGYSMIITPYTKIGNVTLDGESVKIYITENGYEYDKNFAAE